jgi:hypothetical protein
MSDKTPAAVALAEQYLVDYDGTPLADDTVPLDGLQCGTIRALIALTRQAPEAQTPFERTERPPADKETSVFPPSARQAQVSDVPSAATKRMAEILGAEFVLNSEQVSDDAVVEQLRGKLRMIISHASGGHLSEPEDIDRSTNDIAVEISRHHNRIWEHAQESATNSEAVSELAVADIADEVAIALRPYLRGLNARVSHERVLSLATIATQTALAKLGSRAP